MRYQNRILTARVLNNSVLRYLQSVLGDDKDVIYVPRKHQSVGGLQRKTTKSYHWRDLGRLRRIRWDIIY